MRRSERPASSVSRACARETLDSIVMGKENIAKGYLTGFPSRLGEKHERSSCTIITRGRDSNFYSFPHNMTNPGRYCVSTRSSQSTSASEMSPAPLESSSPSKDAAGATEPSDAHRTVKYRTRSGVSHHRQSVFSPRCVFTFDGRSI